MKWVVLASLIAACMVPQPTEIVRTPSGLVRGTVGTSGKFYQYLGVPFAVVDERNRFQAPLPVPKWSGVFEADNENTWCPQTYGGVLVGEPDCLKLNIYTPTVVKRPLPVMVYIHGGCFFGGTGSPYLYGGDFFAENNVIFVAINYRLSVEGFLCLGIKEAPGNAGLRDQIAALKWIQENIEAFGGNPDDVTLFGESAGAVSTSLMILSPAAKGLFHKAILQSGSSLAPWGIQPDPIKAASTLVKKLGYNTKDPHEIYNILQNKTALDIVATIFEHEEKYCVAEKNLFVPCIEKPIEGVEPVLSEYPTDIILSGNYSKVPMIVGYTDKEGIYFVASDYGGSMKANASSINPTELLQEDITFPTEFDKNCTGNKIRDHYFKNYREDLISDMVDFYSDIYIKFPVILESELYMRTNDQPMYYYLFKHDGHVNMAKKIVGYGEVEGASHADELFYMFRPHGFPLPRHLEANMVKRMITMWTNFAKFSDPTPFASSLVPFRWRPSRRTNPTAIVIDNKLHTAALYDEDSVTLWNDTYNKYRRKEFGFTQYGFM